MYTFERAIAQERQIIPSAYLARVRYMIRRERGDDSVPRANRSERASSSSRFIDDDIMHVMVLAPRCRVRDATTLSVAK